MPKRLTVVVSQGQSASPAKRKLEEDLVSGLLFQHGVEVTVIPNLYDLAPDGTGMLCLQGIAGDMVICSWLFPRAAHWILERNGIHGQIGKTLLNSTGDEDDEDGDEDENEQVKAKAESNGDAADDAAGDIDGQTADKEHVGLRHASHRVIYCLDLRTHEAAQPYLDEITRIGREATTETVSLMNWINGSPKPEQLERYLDEGSAFQVPGSKLEESVPMRSAESESRTNLEPGTLNLEPAVRRIDEEPARRWYPVIDYTRCTNCMECLDFCLFGVYGVDKLDTILIEQPDNCRKGCPACSRVCPENAIIFPQHKTPAIAGSDERAGVLKIDLSKLFGGGEGADALTVAVSERDEQLLLVGRDAVGASIGVPKRQAGKAAIPKDDLDSLIDQLDAIDL